jgi:PKD repeat protein
VALGVLGAPGVAAAATADFTVSTAGGQAPLHVDFTDQSTGAGSWFWNFGDGSFSSAQSPSHTYSSPGTYTVKLTVTASDPGDPQQVDTTNPGTTITVTQPPPPPPSADFSATQTPGTLKINFSDISTGNPTSWHWSFGDGTESSLHNPSHIYDVPGSYSVTLTAANAGGPSSITKPITVAPLPPGNNKPAASFTITPNPAAVGGTGATVTVDASASKDPDAGDSIASYRWDFGDDGTVDATTVTASRTYTKATTDVVRLTVTDTHGATDTLLKKITVINEAPPSAAFSFSPATPAVGQSITLSSSSTDPDGSIVKQLWDLDNDGQFDDASGPTVLWSFLAPGPHVISLQVTDDRGVASVAFQTLNVTGPATAQSPASSASGATPPAPASSASRIRPFPVIRIRGLILNGAVRITLLSVKTPRGSKVRVRCNGRGCPFRSQGRTSRSSRRTLRFPGLERRLPVGTIIRVYVTKSKAIGKYTRFRIRSGAAPARLDQCLPAGSLTPRKCPAS